MPSIVRTKLVIFSIFSLSYVITHLINLCSLTRASAPAATHRHGLRIEPSFECFIFRRAWTVTTHLVLCRSPVASRRYYLYQIISRAVCGAARICDIVISSFHKPLESHPCRSSHLCHADVRICYCLQVEIVCFQHNVHRFVGIDEPVRFLQEHMRVIEERHIPIGLALPVYALVLASELSIAFDVPDGRLLHLSSVSFADGSIL